MELKFHNTLSGKLEEFQPRTPDLVQMYHCGPTVYGIQHIGNLSMFVFTDILRRTLEYNNLNVKQVINFTDFGHLTSDADEGEDKMSKGLKTEGLSPTLENMHKLGRKYAKIFLADIAKLNVNTTGTIFPYASDYVQDQIELIKTLEGKHFTYKTSDGIYFDTGKFPKYGQLGGVSAFDTQARVTLNTEKHDQKDFALWKFNNELGWSSPWGQGFPGWHIECSTMIIKLLGDQIDIHTGGIEHIPVHHNNEIAQSEAATGKEPFSKYWLHRAHLQVGGKKIAKSEGNTVYLSEIIEKGFSPLVLRYLLLLSHYRTPTNFTWEALEAARNAYRKLKEFTASLNSSGGKVDEKYKTLFKETIANDLNTPETLAIVWKLVKDKSVSDADKYVTLIDFDRVIGLDLENNEFEIKDIPEDIMRIYKERENARAKKDWKKADILRQESFLKGYDISDTEEGQKLTKI